MKVRIGLPKTSGALPGACERLGAPALISASALWVKKGKRFRAPSYAICDLDCALDSAGFVAMTHYGGYPWTVEQYVELAGQYSWAWWAQMDFCCEPSLAKDKYAVDARIWASAYNLAYCRKVAHTWKDAGAFWLQDPMPVLQGWKPKDYINCARLYNNVLEGRWPDLVGIGSVCRRSLYGEDGLLSIVDTLSEELPPHVGFHLFGVKGAAIPKLNDRVVSVDSAAWQYRARMDALHNKKPCTIALKSAVMKDWYEKQGGQVPPEQEK